MAKKKTVPARTVKTQSSLREDKTVLQKRNLMTSTILNGLILYAVFVFFLNKGSIKVSGIKLSFGVIGLYIGSVYLRFILNNIKGRKKVSSFDWALAIAGPILIALYIAGILGKILFFSI